MAQGTRTQNPHVMFVSEQPFPGAPDDGTATFTINWADHPRNRLAAMQFGNPRELKLIGDIALNGSSIHAVVQELYKPLQRYSTGTVGHWYRMPKELVLGYVADANQVISQNPTRPQFSLREGKAPMAPPNTIPMTTPIHSYTAKVKEPWVEVNRSRHSRGTSKNRFAELGPQGNGNLKVSSDGVLSINSVPIPKSPPPQQFRVAVALDPGLKTIAAFETPPVQPANVQPANVQASNVTASNLQTPSIYDLF